MTTDPITPESDPATPPGPDARPRRRRFPRRISLRGLMLLVLLIGGGLGWTIHRVQVQRDAVAALEKVGFRIGYRWAWAGSEQASNAPAPPWPNWVVDWLGPDYFRYVSSVYGGFDPNQPVNDEIMSQLGRLDRVENVSVGEIPNLKDEHLSHISGLTQLEVLSIGVSRVEGPGLDHLKRMARLKTLNLGNLRLDDDDLAHLSGLTSLETLQSDNAGAVTDAGLAHLVGLNHLENLILKGGSRITTSGLNSLREMTQLRHLALPAARIDSIEPIAHLGSLMTLQLQGNPITDAGLQSVSRLKRLENLHLSQTRITDDGLDHLIGLKRLDFLVLDDNKLSDDGIGRLANLPALKVLHVNRSGLTIAGYDHFGSMNGSRKIVVQGTFDAGGRLTSFQQYLPISVPQPGQAP